MDSSALPKSDPLILLMNEIEILLAQSRLLELYLKQAQTTAAFETARAQEHQQAELAGLRAALAEKEQLLSARQMDAITTERNLLERVTILESDLGEKQQQLARRAAEVDGAKSQSAGLRARVAQLEAALEQIQDEARLAATVRHELELELAGVRQQLETNQRQLEQQQLAAQITQRDLQNQLAELQTELAEKLARSNAAASELQQGKREIGSLQERIAELQLSRREADAAMARELEQARASFAADLALLQAAIVEREHALEESRSATLEIERDLRTKMLTLRSELEQKQELVEFRDDELRAAQAQIAALQQRVDDLETAEHSARASENEIEDLRGGYESELATLRHEVAVRERALTERQEAVSAVELALHVKIQSLQQDLARSRSLIDQREEELENFRAEVVDLRERIGRQESVAAADLTARRQAEETQRRLETEISTLHDSLTQKESALKEQETSAAALTERLRGEINQLQSRLDEQRAAADLGNAELERLQSTVAALRAEKTQLEQSRQDLERDYRQAATLNQKLETRLQAKNDEFKAAQLQASEQREAALRAQRADFTSTETQLRSEIGRRESELEAQQKAAEELHEKLVRLRGENASLDEQRLRSAQFRVELEQRRQETGTLQQELEARLQAKDEVLQTIRSGAQALQRQLDDKIAELQLQLVEKQLLAESRAAEIDKLKAAAGQLTNQLAQHDAASAEAGLQLEKEIELSRAGHESQIAALRDEYQVKQQGLESDLSTEKQRVSDLNRQIGEFERRHVKVAAELEERRQDLQAATAEASALRSRLNELEAQLQSRLSAAEQEQEQLRVKFDADLAAARNELQQKAWASAQQQATVENLALAHKSQLEKLEAKIAEQQNYIAERNLNLEKSQSQVRLLELRSEELAAELRQAERTAIDRAVEIKEEYGLRIAELERQVAQRTSELQERSMSQSDLEQNLRREIDRLIREAQERNQILQNRNDEVVRVKAELDGLQERFSQTESGAAEAEAVWSGESERMRVEFQAQLALLQAELSQKEWALEERQAAAHGLEQHYREEIDSLRQQLTQKETIKVGDKGEFVLGEPEPHSLQETRFEAGSQAKPGDEESSPSNHHRRWHSGFGWKRRWKSSDSL